MIHANDTLDKGTAAIDGYILWNGRTKIVGLRELGHPIGDPGWKYINEVTGKDFVAGDYTVITAPFKAGDNVRVGMNCIIEKGCEFGNNVTVDDGCNIPAGTKIEDGFHWRFRDTLKAVMKD